MKSVEEGDGHESLEKWNFDFDVDSDSNESFNSTSMMTAGSSNKPVAAEMPITFVTPQVQHL